MGIWCFVLVFPTFLCMHRTKNEFSCIVFASSLLDSICMGTYAKQIKTLWIEIKPGKKNVEAQKEIKRQWKWNRVNSFCIQCATTITTTTATTTKIWSAELAWQSGKTNSVNRPHFVRLSFSPFVINFGFFRRAFDPPHRNRLFIAACTVKITHYYYGEYLYLSFSSSI